MNSENEPKMEPWPRSPETPAEHDEFGMPLWVLRLVQVIAYLGLGLFVLAVLLILGELALRN